MARRRKKQSGLDVFELLFKGGLLLGGLLFFSPSFRQAMYAMGEVCLALAALAVIGGLVFVTVRAVGRRSGARQPETVASVINLNDFSVAVGREQASAASEEGVSPKAASPTPANEAPSRPALIQHIRSLDWFQFEKLVEATYHKLGYAVTRRGGANPDGGIDLVAEKNGDLAAIQCKQWKNREVGVKAVREFLGALTDAGIGKGVFVTVCGYTEEARALAEKHGIELVNEAGLAALLESVDAAYDPEMVAILRDPRKFCPKCEAQMVLRTASKGRNVGSKFWGCSTYPKCDYTMTFA
jgi:hypothetical protein